MGNTAITTVPSYVWPGGHGTTYVWPGGHGTTYVWPGGHGTTYVWPGGHGTTYVWPGGHGTTYVCPVDMAQRMCARWTWHNVCVPGGHGTTYVCPVDMAHRFGDNFIEKVLNIRKDIVDCGEDGWFTTMAAMSNDAVFGGVQLVCFETVTESDVERLVASAPVKSCELDPIPTWLLKQCSHELVPLITATINTSLTTSNVPADFKHAIIKPLLRKPTLHKDILQNYRPVSNLPFVSKLVEKVVAKQISTHVDENALRDPFQYACRRGHSTKTALFRVKNDIAAALDRKCTTILVTLDLSCAFDTVEHELLMTRFEHSFGITDRALVWLQSYISERYQKVAVGSAESVDSILTCGVPQGSVLGPTLYCMYNKPIGDIVARHGMQYHCYADDTQIYLTVERDESIVAAMYVVYSRSGCMVDQKPVKT